MIGQIWAPDAWDANPEGQYRYQWMIEPTLKRKWKIGPYKENWKDPTIYRAIEKRSSYIIHYHLFTSTREEWPSVLEDPDV